MSSVVLLPAPELPTLPALLLATSSQIACYKFCANQTVVAVAVAVVVVGVVVAVAVGFINVEILLLCLAFNLNSMVLFCFSYCNKL